MARVFIATTTGGSSGWSTLYEIDSCELSVVLCLTPKQKGDTNPWRSSNPSTTPGRTQVISTAAEAIRAVVTRRVETLEDPRERLLCVIDSLFSCYDENQDLLLIYTRATNGLPWRIREAMGEEPLHILRDFIEWVIGLARHAESAGALRGLDPEAFALSLVGAINTASAYWLETAPDRPLSKAAPAVRAVFERILG